MFLSQTKQHHSSVSWDLFFLMFMAGLETRFSSFKDYKKDIFVISILNASLPFVVGFLLAYFFGYSLLGSLLLGVIFISSSVAVIIPTLERNGLIKSRLGRSVLAATVTEDVASLVLLSVLLQSIEPVANLPLPSFYLLLLVSLLAMRWALPRMQRFFAVKKSNFKDPFHQNLRSVFALLVGIVIIFEALGLHPIIAGFFAGLVLSGAIASEHLEDKIKTIAYGVFIPTFFVVLGAELNFALTGHWQDILFFVLAVIFFSLLSKLLSGFLSGKILGYSTKDSLLIGAITMPQLSTTLAVVYSAVEFGLLDDKLIVTMVGLSIISVVVSPILVTFFNKSS